MDQSPTKCRLLMEKWDSGYLMTLLRGEEINVRPEDCLGLLSDPIFNGENASFEITQEQFDTIRCRAAARQSREAAALAAQRSAAKSLVTIY